MMDPRTTLKKTLDDLKLSRGERQALVRAFADVGAGARLFDQWRAAAFDLARESLAAGPNEAIVDWLEDVTRALTVREEDDKPSSTECHFSPGEDCRRAICRQIDHAAKSIDVCVFTITDDRLTDALVAAHHRGVIVRIVTDNDKSADLGSDIDRLKAAGVTVRVDRSENHMHHKFAIFDGSVLINGSYNWTVGAARDNEENLIVTDDPRLTGAFLERFERLWQRWT